MVCPFIYLSFEKIIKSYYLCLVYALDSLRVRLVAKPTISAMYLLNTMPTNRPLLSSTLSTKLWQQIHHNSKDLIFCRKLNIFLELKAQNRRVTGIESIPFKVQLIFASIHAMTNQSIKITESA